ncbi:MAG TPA: MCE family protein, partial [Planctomycetaceae bacterium]|nr:MCE family protein [Planctomycetaceae bacterium]
MDERMIQFRIGVMVLATVVIAAILLVVFGEGPELFRPTYRVTIRAPEAAGVTIGTPVRRRGILIGRISDVRFDEAGREVVLTARIYSQFTIRQNEQCVITAGLLGEPEVDFGPPAEGPLAEATVPPGASLTATVRRGPVEVITNLEQRLATAADSVRTTSKRVEAAAEQITNLLKVNEETITSMLQKADRNMEILGQAVGNLNELIADEEVRQRIREGLAQLPDLVQQASDTLKSVDTTF